MISAGDPEDGVKDVLGKNFTEKAGVEEAERVERKDERKDVAASSDPDSRYLADNI